MNKLEILNKNGQLVVSSRKVAESFEKEHFNLIRDIENIFKNEPLKIEGLKYFIPTTFIHKGNEYKEYLLTRDGFSLLVMGFTGAKALGWKIKYIDAFNDMEQSLKSVQPKLSVELQAIIMIDQRTTDTVARLDNFENNMPLFNTDCKNLQSLVKRIGTKALGGYRSPAYKDNSLRAKVYKDIHGQLRRQFGVERYESIKRIQMEPARKTLENYNLPMFLQDDITLLNNQISILGVN